MPKISVVMNCADGVGFLKDAIDSVFAQTFQDWEIIFVDNCSTDGSAELARSYEYTGRLRYVRLEKRIPLYAARNVALENTQGEFVSFNDADDVLEPDMLEQLHAKMRPGIDVVYGGYRYIDRTGRFLSKAVQGHARGNILNALMMRSFIAIGCILLRRRLFNDERFDPTYNLKGDFALWVRLFAEGCHAEVVEKYLTRIRIHGGNLSITQEKRWIVEERRFYRNFLAQHGLRHPMILFFIAKYEFAALIGHKRL